ncbi:MAG: phosphonate ABC transporter substrate-binding protein [Cyanobacteria bacterium J06632_22]
MMTKQYQRFSALSLIAVLSIGMVSACSRADSDSAPTAADGSVCAPEFETLEFGVYPTESQVTLEPLWTPIFEDMSEALGREVVGFFATDYAAIIEAMGVNKIQIAWYGGKSYIEAAARSNAEAFAQSVESDGSKGYYSYLITSKDNPILQEIDLDAGNGDQYVVQNAGDLTFAFNDPNSTSGFLVPSYYVFAQNNIVPEEDFAELIFAGSHEATALAVAENQVDVATNNSDNLARLETLAPDALEKIQIIWTSPIIPSDPLAYRADLPDCLKEEIKTFILGYDNQTVLADLESSGFDPADDAIWDTVRELEYSKQLLEVQNDDTLSAADKDQKLDEINKMLEGLNR